MPFINFTAGQKVKLFDGVNASLAHSDKMTFAHVNLDEGANIPEHSHPHEQWMHVVRGHMEFNIAGEVQRLSPGMAAYIPANAPHSAKAVTFCQVIDCFSPVREDLKALEK